jgi:Uma2 family endonuclease
MRATYQDVIDAPEHVVAEILGGELVLSPRPSPRHALAEGCLFSVLRAPFVDGEAGPGGWVLLPEPELHFTTDGLDVLVPDLAGWRRERLPAMPETAAVTVAPDWVCEVLSPGTEKRDRSIKMKIYAREGVSYLWFLQPDGQILEAYRLAVGRWENIATWKVGAANATIVRAVPFDALAFDLANLWKW